MKKLLPNKHGVLFTVVAAAALLWTGVRLGGTHQKHAPEVVAVQPAQLSTDPTDAILAEELTAPTSQQEDEHDMVEIVRGLLDALGDFAVDAEPIIAPIVMYAVYKKMGIGMTQGESESPIEPPIG